MSREAVNDILNRSLLDEKFRHAIQTDPAGTFEEYELTEEERSALLSRNLARVAVFAGRDAMALYCTIRFAIFENIVALKPLRDVSRQAELESRGDEIARMEGEQGEVIEAIKEFLVRMR